MSVTINIPAQELAAIKQLTQEEDDGNAIMQAARQFLRIARLRELKTASGKVDFDLDWGRLEEIEMQESPLPQ